MIEKPTLSVGLVLALTLISAPSEALGSPSQAEDERGACSSGGGDDYVAVAANPAAARAGCEVLANGGTAIDAAVAIQASLTVVEPQASGFGGGALLTYFDAESSQTKVFDGLASSGAETTASLSTPTGKETQDHGIEKFTDAVDYSARAVGVPGAAAVLDDVHEQYGKKPWRDLFDDSIDQAADGFALAPYTASLMEEDSPIPMCSYPDIAKIYCNDGQAKAEGAKITNPDLADLLTEIRDGGAESFYDPNGTIAPALVDRMKEGDQFDPVDSDGDPAVIPSLIDVKDFAEYEPIERQPLCENVQKVRLCTTPAPSGGGTALLNILQIAAEKNIASYDADSADYAHLMIEASRLAGVDIRTFVGDPDIDDAPPEALSTPEYAAERAKLIGMDSSIHPVEAGKFEGASDGPAGAGAAQDQTSQVAVIDSYGNALSMTTTVNSNFGARVLARGMVLNNSSVNFNVAGSPINEMEPFKRPRTTIAPSIGFDSQGEVDMVVGSAGGAPIPDYIAQAVLGIGTYGLSPADALAQPHVSGQAKIEDCGGVPDFASTLESKTDAESLLPDLRERGAVCSRAAKLLSGAGAIAVNPGGGFDGAADPRRDGDSFGG